MSSQNNRPIRQLPPTTKKELLAAIRQMETELETRNSQPPLTVGQRLNRDIRNGKFDSIWDEIPILSWVVERRLMAERDREIAHGMGGKAQPAGTRTPRQRLRKSGGAPRNVHL